MKGVPAAVITIWMPALFFAGLCLLLRGLQPRFWFICIPVIPLLGFMNTLAEIRSKEKQVRIKRWWGSICISESEILEISQSRLEGILRLRIRRFVPPWGVVYFVADWSNIETLRAGIAGRHSTPSDHPRERVSNLISSVLLGISGFVLGRALTEDFHKFSIENRATSILILATSVGFAGLFAFARKRAPTLANLLLFAAMFIVALLFGYRE
jgi:hypothetical protein